MDQLISLWRDFQEAEQMHNQRIGDIESRLKLVTFATIKSFSLITTERVDMKTTGVSDVWCKFGIIR